MKDQFIKFPLTRQEITNKIDETYGIPQIVGAIDGYHIETNAPPRNHEDDYNLNPLPPKGDNRDMYPLP